VAVKIVRQLNKIVLLGAPTSAAAMSLGHEGAPVALRAAGLAQRLSAIGYTVTDMGDDPARHFEPDEESPRARNLPRILAAVETLKPRVELAVKSAALPLILGGDCSIALATVAGVRRYFRHVSMIYMDRDADLNTPATTASGCVDGMVVSHLTGRGAAELVRFWGEPPLVREPDLALFGVERLDAPEDEVLQRSTIRSYFAKDIKRTGAAAAAQTAVDRIRGNGYEFVLHFDVDVIADFAATNYPGSGGLQLEEVRDALKVFVSQKHLAAIEVTAYNPAKDADGGGAKLIIDLLAEVFAARLETLSAASSAAGPAPEASAERPAETKSAAAGATAARETGDTALSAAQPGEAWPSDSLDSEADASSDESGSGSGHSDPSESSTETDGSPS